MQKEVNRTPQEDKGGARVPPVNTWLAHCAIPHQWPRLSHVVAPVPLPPRRLGEDDARVVQVHGSGVAARARTPGGWAQGKFQTWRGGDCGGGGSEDRAVDGPGSGGDVDWVVWLPLGLVWLVLGVWEEAQSCESPRVILARAGGRKAKERERDLGVGGLLLRTSTRLAVGGLRRARKLGWTLGGGARLRRVRWSLATVRLHKRKRKVF